MTREKNQKRKVMRGKVEFGEAMEGRSGSGRHRVLLS
jgi:hypothetical protein